MTQLQIQGVTVNYRASGSGPAVILTHGGGSSGAQWRKVTELLGGRFTLVTVDHYGHGGTDPWPGEPRARTHEAEAALVRAVIDVVGGPAHLVGHSYGGGVALRLVLGDPACARSLTLIEPMAISMLKHGGEQALRQHYLDFAQAFIRDAAAGDAAGAWERFIDGNGEPGTWAKTPPEARARFLAMTPAVVSGWYANMSHATTPEECRGIALPTLLLRGERTRDHFRRITELLAEAIPGATLGVLPEAGHMSPISHPQAVAEALVPFLAAH